jgi:hypothetical protein
MNVKTITQGVAMLAGTLVFSAGVSANSPGVQAYLENKERAITGQDFVCGDTLTARINNRVNDLVPNVCAQLNTENTLADNPHRYENPQATCDLGLSLPGLPTFDGFGFDAKGVDACGVVQNIIGDRIKSVSGKYDEASKAISDGLSHNETVDFEYILDNMLN